MTKFNNPQGLNKFWLITLCEYLESETSKGGNARTVKWTLPLIWANTMVCDASVRPHDVNRLKEIYLEEIINAIKKCHRGLNELFDFNDTQVPDLVAQAIRVAV